MNEITCIIKTFERPKHRDRLINSIREFYPTMKIIVADDSKNPVMRNDVEYYVLKYDVGLSAGRNLLVRKVKTKYFVLLDDDFKFTKETDLLKFKEVLKNTDIDIVGGRLFQIESYSDYSGIMEEKKGVVRYKKKSHKEFDSYKIVDIIFNFFMAKTKSFDDLKWDEELKLAEHFDFFYNIRGKKKVAIMPEVVIEHQPFDLETSNEYRKKRGRAKGYFKYLLKKNNLKRVLNYEGNIIID